MICHRLGESTGVNRIMFEEEKNLRMDRRMPIRSGQVRSGQVRSGQVRSGQVRAGQVRAGQIRSGQVRETRLYIYKLSIPSTYI